jgi:hypothetical protein
MLGYLARFNDEIAKLLVKNPLKRMIDNKLAISLVKNPISHDRIKHIENPFYFIKEHIS